MCNRFRLSAAGRASATAMGVEQPFPADEDFPPRPIFEQADTIRLDG
jgi:hypothetical protein